MKTLTFALASIVLAGCGVGMDPVDSTDDVGALEQGVVSSQTLKYNDTYDAPEFNPCTGNVVTIHQTHQNVLHITTKSENDFLFQLSTRIESTWTDGTATYFGRQAYDQTWRQTEKTVTRHLQNDAKVNGDDGHVVSFHRSAHLVVNADGTHQLFFDNQSLTCIK